MFYSLQDPTHDYSEVSLTHHARPGWLVDAQDDMERAWALHNDAIDTEDRELVDERRKCAEYLEGRYMRMKARYDGLKATILDTECTCNGTEPMACPHCRARSQLRYGSDIPYNEATA